MEEIKKELTEMKEILSKLLELQNFDHKMKYGYLSKTLEGSTQKN